MEPLRGLPLSRRSGFEIPGAQGRQGGKGGSDLTAEWEAGGETVSQTVPGAENGASFSLRMVLPDSAPCKLFSFELIEDTWRHLSHVRVYFSKVNSNQAAANPADRREL